MSADTPRFAVATFMRVFDVQPVQDALTLPELAAALQRFLVKPRLKERIDEDVAQIRRAVELWKRGEAAPGRAGAKLDAIAREARERNLDPLQAVLDRANALENETRREAKKDFRLWAPLLFRPGGKRETADVVHVSCLVLDYDDGSPLEEANDVWRPWFHIIHTTWSHTPTHPKFRVVLPLARPVAPDAFVHVWRWAEDRTGFAIDPTGKGVARAYAIPVVPDARAARRALAHAGPLLDPVLEGVIDAPSPEPLPAETTLSPGLLRHDPGASWVEGSAEAAPALDISAFEDEAIDWEGGAQEPVAPIPATVVAERLRPAAPPLATGAAVDEIVARLDAVVARLDALGEHVMVDGLERITSLYEQGALDAEEFSLAKERLLRR